MRYATIFISSAIALIALAGGQAEATAGDYGHCSKCILEKYLVYSAQDRSIPILTVALRAKDDCAGTSSCNKRQDDVLANVDPVSYVDFNRGWKPADETAYRLAGGNLPAGHAEFFH